MTAVEFDRLSGGTGPAHAHGWLVSMCCHLLGVGCAVLLMAEIEKPVLPTPFQWEVAVVEAPPSAIPPPVEPARAPSEPHPVKRVMETQPPVAPPVPVQQAVRDVSRAVEAVEPVQEAVREISRTVETVEPVLQAVSEVATQAEASIERPMTQSVQSQVVAASQQAVVEQSVSQMAVTAQVARAQPADMPTPIEAVPHAVDRESTLVETASPAIEHRAVQQRLVRHRDIRADYGWLSDALWRRIEELKRYPAQAKINHWEGKVVVEAVIRADGEVIGLSIAESSGRALLDQEALAVMKKASPLALKHPLGAPRVTILVPISYRLDG
ncbi:MAG: TonB family protein [Nitrospira sp.]|nr:TonB family protein [Nitrospira sp.]